MHLRRLFNYLKRPAHSPHLNDDFPISSFVCTFLSALPSRDHAERATEPMYVSLNRLNADPPSLSSQTHSRPHCTTSDSPGPSRLQPSISRHNTPCSRVGPCRTHCGERRLRAYLCSGQGVWPLEALKLMAQMGEDLTL